MIKTVKEFQEKLNMLIYNEKSAIHPNIQQFTIET